MFFVEFFWIIWVCFELVFVLVLIVVVVMGLVCYVYFQLCYQCVYDDFQNGECNEVGLDEWYIELGLGCLYYVVEVGIGSNGF